VKNSGSSQSIQIMQRIEIILRFQKVMKMIIMKLIRLMIFSDILRFLLQGSFNPYFSREMAWFY